MGIYNALFTGSSGLSAFGEAIRVVGDNIANVNSLGFKSQNVVFADVLSQTVGVTRSNIANQVGGGVRIGQITRNDQQGSIQNTTSPTDMAINGRGMFALKDPANGQTFYTRAGAFFLDKDSNLIDGQGFVVQGWELDSATSKAIGNIKDVSFANLAAQASPTTVVKVGVSLDSNASVITGSVADAKGNFDPASPTTFNYKTQVNIFDSLGQEHSVSTYYVKTSANSWNWYAGVDGGEVTAGTTDSVGVTAATGTTFIGARGTLAYNSVGALDAETLNAATTNFPWNSAAASTVGFDFGNAITTDTQGPLTAGTSQTGTGLNGTIQMAGSFATREMKTDGFAAGFLDKLETDSTGRVFGSFTNGQRRGLFQVALANFPNAAVLSKVGNNLQQETISSGQAVFEKPGNGGMGSITPFGLEQSNVDLAGEFVKLIVIQRGYEANSKTILTTDQMLSSLMQIKR